MRKSKEKLFLYIGFCLAMLPVLFLRDATPANELRYLSIADEALRNHTFFTFTNHGMIYADKPPLYLWIVMLLRYIFGSHQIWALTLASLVPALVTVRVMDKWVTTEMDAGTRSVSRIMLLTGGLFPGLALTLRMDMLMCMFIVLAMHTFWHIYTNDDKTGRSKWLFPAYLFLALFTKGPLGLLIPMLSIAVFLIIDRQWKKLATVFGWRTWTVLLIGCAAWFGMVYNEGGTEYLNNLLFHQTVDRAVKSFHHERPFYFYFISIWYSIAPWSVFAVMSIAMALRKGVVRSRMHTFFITASVTTIVLLSCISSKLPVYMLPAIPFIIYAAAMYMPRTVNSKWSRIAIIIPEAILVFTLPALLVAVRFSSTNFLNKPMLYVAALIMSVSSIHVIYILIHKKNDTYAIEEAIKRIGASMLISVYVAAFALPKLNKSIGYSEVCNAAKEMAQDKQIDRFVAWNTKNAADMDVYLDRKVTEIPKEADPAKCVKPKTILFIPSKYKDDFKEYDLRTVGKFTVVAIE